MILRTKQFLGTYWKCIIAIFGAVLVVVQSAVSDNVITTQEWMSIATAFIVAVGVYWVPNTSTVALAPADFGVDAGFAPEH